MLKLWKSESESGKSEVKEGEREREREEKSTKARRGGVRPSSLFSAFGFQSRAPNL